jgi:3-hydroxyacyl-CoA dehydrogenase
MAKVSTSAYEAFDTGLLQQGKDIVATKTDKLRSKKHALLIC